MKSAVIETTYPATFRKEETDALLAHIQNHHSVLLVGMARVGIGNFLRFFLNHPSIHSRLAANNHHHLFILVDLHDLVERELYAFWMLTCKRILDTIQNTDVSPETKKQAELLFVNSIQSKDLFFLVDGIRAILTLLIEEGYTPTLFFNRFDRIKDAITDEFFANLVGLKEHMHGRLSYVFTSARTLHDIAPTVFTKPEVAAFVHTLYIHPANPIDTQIVLASLKKQYAITIPSLVEQQLLDLTQGHMQYVYLATLLLHEHPHGTSPILALLEADERVQLLSEEILSSLTPREQQLVLDVYSQSTLSELETEDAQYLIHTGILVKNENKYSLFTKLLTLYLDRTHVQKKEEKQSKEFSKKELLLFTYLTNHSGEICERDAIIQAVWPEEEVFGVSDWAIDRLVSRVRSKLRVQQSAYEIVTIKTRGYKIVEKQ